MRREQVFLWIQSILIIAVAVLSACGAVHIYLEGSARQAADPSAKIYTAERIAKAAEPVLPVLCAGIAVTAAGAVLRIKNKDTGRPVRDEELASRIRSLKASGKNINEWNKNPMPEDRQGKLRILLFFLGAVFVIAGIINGSMSDVLVKAVNVCTECVGLG